MGGVRSQDRQAQNKDLPYKGVMASSSRVSAFQPPPFPPEEKATQSSRPPLGAAGEAL